MAMGEEETEDGGLEGNGKKFGLTTLEPGKRGFISTEVQNKKDECRKAMGKPGRILWKENVRPNRYPHVMRGAGIEVTVRDKDGGKEGVDLGVMEFAGIQLEVIHSFSYSLITSFALDSQLSTISKVSFEIV